MPATYQSQILDHLGLVAGMFDELGIGEVLDRRIAQDASRRQVSVGQAVKAMVLNGLGFVNQQLYLVPSFFDNKPLERLIGPEIEAAHLNDDVLGRALDTLYEVGVTPLYTLIATEACTRLGLASPYVHLDTTSFHVDGRYNSAEAPEDRVIHITQGYSRDHRPDLNQVMLELMVEHQAGIPLWMKPLSGNSSDPVEFGRVVDEHLAQLCGDDLPRYVVADSALYSAENLGKLATSAMQWITRVPATLNEVQAHLANVDLATLAPLTDGYHYLEVSSSFGGVEQRWLVVHSEARQQRVQRTADQQLAKQSDAERKAFKKLCAQTFACEADARQALEQFKATLAVSRIEGEAMRTMARYEGRGRPAPGQPPARVDYALAGALASSLATRQALLAQKSCFVLATNELDAQALGAPEVLAAYKAQSAPERGFRFLKSPEFLAASLYLKKPERIMALLMVMTVCLLVYAALEYRLRQALREHDETFPDQKGHPTRRPTARWVFHVFVGIHVLLGAMDKPLILNLQEHHLRVLKVMGTAYESLYS
jgi:transposase